jgi:hypothetical protein
VVWLVVSVAQVAENPMDPMQVHVLAAEMDSLKLHPEDPACDSASQHSLSLENDDVYWE